MKDLLGGARHSSPHRSSHFPEARRGSTREARGFTVPPFNPSRSSGLLGSRETLASTFNPFRILENEGFTRRGETLEPTPFISFSRSKKRFY
jgi:hypothetical protein